MVSHYLLANNDSPETITLKSSIRTENTFHTIPVRFYRTFTKYFQLQLLFDLYYELQLYYI